MAAEVVSFPASWDSIVASRKNNEAIYLRPTEANLLTLGRPKMIELAYKDYKTLQLERERWLAMRISGELKFAEMVDAVINDVEADDNVEYDMYRAFVNVGIDTDIHTLLLPQSISQGLLTNLYHDSVGWGLYRDMKRYDTALLITMEACFKKISVPDAVDFIDNEYDPSAPIEDNVHTKLLSHRLLRANDNEDEFRHPDPQITTTTAAYYPIQQINAIPAASGRNVVRAIFEELCPKNLSANVRAVIRATVYAWVIAMMQLPETDRTKFIVERTRIGLVSNFVVAGTMHKSLFPRDEEPVAADWFLLANATPELVNTPPLADLVTPMVNGIIAMAKRQPVVDPPSIFIFDYKIRSESVFYTNSTIPIFIACATCILYLHKQTTHGVFPGTESAYGGVDNDVEPPKPMTAREAGMISLTTYTIHQLNMSLSELRMDDGYLPPTWSPHATDMMRGKTWRETATNLIAAWRESRADSADKWIRGLKAAMLVIDGNIPPPQTE
jgi:hypothetical protein